VPATSRSQFKYVSPACEKDHDDVQNVWSNFDIDSKRGKVFTRLIKADRERAVKAYETVRNARVHLGERVARTPEYWIESVIG